MNPSKPVSKTYRAIFLGGVIYRKNLMDPELSRHPSKQRRITVNIIQCYALLLNYRNDDDDDNDQLYKKLQ